YNAGYWDAPDFFANSSYVLAEGIFNTGYGYAEDLLDYDNYDLGSLSPGRYTVKVESYDWDFSIFSSSLTPNLELYRNGLNTLQFDFLGQIDFVVEATSNYSIRVKGGSSFGTEYRVYYVYNGPLEAQNNPAIFTNATYYTTNGLNDNSTVSISVTTLDIGGVTDPFYLTTWYLNGTVFKYTTIPELEISQNEVGKSLGVRVSFLDDLGNFELSPLYIIGAISNVNDPPQGGVLISGVVGVDEFLSA